MESGVFGGSGASLLINGFPPKTPDPLCLGGLLAENNGLKIDGRRRDADRKIGDRKMFIMARPRSRSSLFFLSAIFLSAPLIAAAEPVMAGAIEGTVTYQADPARPWRDARDYVKQAKTGEPGEAGVGLRGQPGAPNPP